MARWNVSVLMVGVCTFSRWGVYVLKGVCTFSRGVHVLMAGVYVLKMGCVLGLGFW